MHRPHALSVLGLALFGLLAGCNPVFTAEQCQQRAMDAGSGPSSASGGGYRSQAARALLFRGMPTLTSLERRELCYGPCLNNCAAIRDTDARFLCRGECTNIVDLTLRRLCLGESDETQCNAISDLSLRNFCLGARGGSDRCLLLTSPQDRALCQGPADPSADGGTNPCALLTDLNLRNFCQGNCTGVL